ncbi:putative O-linked-mannose beta-1-2-N-acetylglucosaminyltransferase 1-like 4, partial [Homarus americanus]
GVDWDLWVLQNIIGERDILVPEIPRTKHRGGGGAHVTGTEQAQHYNQQPLNTFVNATLDIQGVKLLNYLKLHVNAIREAQVVRLTQHPCQVLPIPRHQVNQSFVIYIHRPAMSAETVWSYYVVARPDDRSGRHIQGDAGRRQVRYSTPLQEDAFYHNYRSEDPPTLPSRRDQPPQPCLFRGRGHSHGGQVIKVDMAEQNLMNR